MPNKFHERIDNKEYTENGRQYRIQVRYGFDYIPGNTSAHFHVVSGIEQFVLGQWRFLSGGTQHDEVVKHFPHLAPLVKYHGFSTIAPMHYTENAQHWWELYTGESKWSATHSSFVSGYALDNFKSTVAWGVLPSDIDDKLQPAKGRTKDIVDYLHVRLPALMARFRTEVEAHGLNWRHRLPIARQWQ